jgi:hypothetical protein
MADEGDALIGGIFIIVIGIISFIAGFKSMSRYRIISDIPTSKIRSLAMGIVEIYGKIFEEKTIETPISKSKCVYYKFDIQEYKETGSGKSRSCKWVTIYSENKIIPFYAKDDTGKVYVIPDGAEFDMQPKKIFYSKGAIIGSIKTFFGLFNTAKSVSNEMKNKGITDEEKIKEEISKKMKDFSKSNIVEIDVNKKSFFITTIGDRKYFEYFLEPNENVYILGSAFNDRTKNNNLVIKKGENEETFIVSNKNEEELLKSFKKKMLFGFFGGSGMIILGLIIILFSVFI